MKHLFQKASLLAMFLPALLPAQGQATTLSRLSQAAHIVVRATVVSSENPVPKWQRVTLQSDQVLKGQVTNQFSLTEPAGACCGRGLFALQAGDTRILFLRRVGPVLHLMGGGRGVLPTTPDLVNAVQALLAAGTSNELAHLLAQNINHPEPRIADDAALALASLPNLALNVSERLLLAQSLAASVQRGSTRTAALADIAARLGDASAINTVMPLYLQAKRADQASLLGKALARCSADLVAERLPVFVGTARRSNLRAAHLLADLPSATAHAAMSNLLQRPNHPQVQLHLCEGLLAAGMQSASLVPLVPEVVLQMAIKRRTRRPTFRNIRPDR